MTSGKKINLPGYVMKDGKLKRDPKHLDASARRKRQTAAIKRKGKLVT